MKKINFLVRRGFIVGNRVVRADNFRAENSEKRSCRSRKFYAR